MMRFIFASILGLSYFFSSFAAQTTVFAWNVPSEKEQSVSKISDSVKEALNYQGYFFVDHLDTQELDIFKDVCREIGISREPYFIWVRPASLAKAAFPHAKYVQVQDKQTGKTVGVMCLNKSSRMSFLKRRGGVAFPLYRELMYHKRGLNPEQKIAKEVNKQMDLDTFQAMRCQSCIKRAMHRFWFDNWKVLFKSSDPAERLLQEKREQEILDLIPKGSVWSNETFIKEYIRSNAFPEHCSYCRPSKEQKVKRTEKVKVVRQRQRVVHHEQRAKRIEQKAKMKNKKQ